MFANKIFFFGGIVSTIILFILGVIFFIAGAIFPQPYGFYLTFAAIIIMLLLASKHGLLGGSSYGGGYSGGFSGGGYSGGGSFGGGSFGGGGASR